MDFLCCDIALRGRARTSTTCKSSWPGTWARSQKTPLWSDQLILMMQIEVLWTALRQKTYQAEVLVEESNLWLWQSFAIIIYCFSFGLWTLPSVYLRVLRNTWLSEHTLNCMIYLLSIWGCGGCTISVAVTKRHHHYLLLVPLVALFIPSVFTCWSEHTLSHVKPRFCLMSSSFGCDGNSWSNDFTSLFWICILRVPHFWSQYSYTVPFSDPSLVHIYFISTHYNSWS